VAELQFAVRDPKKGYRTNNLLIPKTEVNMTAVKTALSFVIGEEEVIEEGTGMLLGMQPKLHELWDETEHHLIVPRAFLSEETLKEFGFEWVDEAPDLVSKTRVKLPNKIVPRDKVQEAALRAMRKHRGGTVNLACGKGKTVIALKYAVDLGKPTLVVVNAKALMHQWILEIQDKVGKEAKIGIIQGDRCEWKGCDFVLATVQALANKHSEWPMEFRRYFGVVFYDEGHHLSAPHFVKSADLFFGDRFSLTATATRTDGLESIYQYHLGGIIYVYLKQDLIPDTVFHLLDWVPDDDQEALSRDRNGMRHHGRLCIMLGTIDWRNKLIVREVVKDVKEGRQVLCLSHSVEHGRTLLEMYDKIVGKKSKAGLINGVDVDGEDRIPILTNSNPVFGTFQIAREALNKPTLDSLHVCTPFGNSNDLQQAWGRIQRNKEGKQRPRVRMYEDVTIPTCHRQLMKLRRYLRALSYPSRKVLEKP
jgi:superfamily II DNA or RNA helicase